MPYRNYNYLDYKMYNSEMLKYDKKVHLRYNEIQLMKELILWVLHSTDAQQISTSFPLNKGE